MTRRAGAGRLADGSTVVWSVAEGRRGRRWREVVMAADDGIRLSLLLETDPDRRFSHLELSTPAGLVTLHPEGDGTIHGNTIGRSDPGVGHVAGLPWAAGDVLLVEGSVIASAAAVWRATLDVAVGTPVTAGGVVVRADLVVSRETARITREAPASWRIGDDASFDVDDDGLPRLASGRIWPLEQD